MEPVALPLPSPGEPFYDIPTARPHREESGASTTVSLTGGLPDKPNLPAARAAPVHRRRRTIYEDGVPLTGTIFSF